VLLPLLLLLAAEDERFLVKTMRKSEMRVLLEMLPSYMTHMEKYPHSLITRFFGLHKVTPLHGRSVGKSPLWPLAPWHIMYKQHQHQEQQHQNCLFCAEGHKQQMPSEVVPILGGCSRFACPAFTPHCRWQPWRCRWRGAAGGVPLSVVRVQLILYAAERLLPLFGPYVQD